MYDGDVLSWDFVDRDVANFVSRVWRVDEEKDVPTVKRRLHRATGDGLKCNTRSAQEMNSGKVDAPKDNNNRRFSVCNQPETLVNHKTRREDGSEIEGLE